MSFAFLDHFSTLAPRYDVVLCDIWGVVHNGLAAHPAAASDSSCPWLDQSLSVQQRCQTQERNDVANQGKCERILVLDDQTRCRQLGSIGDA